MSGILIANLVPCLIEEQPFQRQYGPDHVFTDSLSLACGLSSDLAVDVEPCVAPPEILLDQRKADELFPQKQGKDFVGEYLLDNLIMENSFIFGFPLVLDYYILWQSLDMS